MSKCQCNRGVSVSAEVPDIRIRLDRGADYSPYQGEYETRSVFNETITLPTKGKSLSDNITVQPIRVWRVFNDKGGITVIIGT